MCVGRIREGISGLVGMGFVREEELENRKEKLPFAFRTQRFSPHDDRTTTIRSWYVFHRNGQNEAKSHKLFLLA